MLAYGNQVQLAKTAEKVKSHLLANLSINILSSVLPLKKK